MPEKNIFFNVPLPYLFEHEDLLKQYPVNVELFVDGEDLERLDPEQVERAKALLDGYRLGRRVHGPISEMVPGAFDPRIREATRSRFRQAIDFAAQIGAGAIVVHSGYDTLNKRHLEERYVESCAPVLRELCRRAAERRVTLLLENTFEPGPALLLDAVAKAEADNLKLCFDVAHHHVFGSVPLQEWLERCAPLIEEVHITDNDGGWDDHFAPGKGAIDFGAFFDLLAVHGIRPVFTFEPHCVEAFVDTLGFIESHPDYFA